MGDPTEEERMDSAEHKQTGLSNWMGIRNNGIAFQDYRGTFKDSMKAPIHRWYRYSAGFSHSLVEDCFKKYGVSRHSIVLDPFVGVGTTCVSAKRLQIASVGVEAHPLVAWIARVKTDWDFDFPKLNHELEQIIYNSKKKIESPLSIDITNKPKLLQKSFSPERLHELYTLKEYLFDISDEKTRNLCMLSLITILRKVSKADTGWPYILPNKERLNTPDVFPAFRLQLKSMLSDLQNTVTNQNRCTPVCIVNGDARSLSRQLDREFDFCFTSPPYLNNYDFADRTRLELYFISPFEVNGKMINTSTWGDISKQVRSKLLVNATHQAVEMGLKEGLQPNHEIEPSVREELSAFSDRLRKEKADHSGHKDYDIMVVAYFNDMFETLREVYSVMKQGSFYLLILGDSAPYGIHIPTDELLARIAIGVGFSEYKIVPLRARGDKWKSAPKHKIPLRETMVILRK